jgi:hypothetical protein
MFGSITAQLRAVAQYARFNEVLNAGVLTGKC